MLDFILIAGIITFILIIWFNTDAFAEYCNLFKINSFLKGYNNDTTAWNFVQYLTQNKKIIAKDKPILQFFLKLITCPYCINTWLCIVGSLYLDNLLYMPVLYIVTLFVYFRIYPSKS